MVWHEWKRAAFEKAERERRPVLLHLASATSRLASAIEAVYAQPAVSQILASRFVAVRVVAEDRPDIAARYASPDAAPRALAADGTPLASLPFFAADDLVRALGKCADAFGAPPPAAAPRKSAAGRAGALDPSWPGSVMKGLSFDGTDAVPRLEPLELLLYAAREWKDRAILDALLFQLSRYLRGEAWDKKDGGFARPDELRRLDLNARLARVYLDAHALTGDEPCREAGFKLTECLLSGFYDARVGAFRFVADSSCPAVFYVDANAMAACAMLRAASLGKGGEWREAADRALVFIANMFDAERGMAHRWDGKASIHGLLGDNAWAMLSLTESFLTTGNRPHRDLADAVLRLLFQQLWESDGGFLDRAAQEDDVAGLGRPLMLGGLNAVALEAAWRLHHLKGNVHYGRWTEDGLRAAISRVDGDPSAAASLARVQDMVLRGRLDLELVGRVGDAATEEMLAAVNRHYLPRRIVSFVDPDDQDFILPHKLKAPTWPRLFGCIDLRPKAEASRPDEVRALLDEIS